MNTSLYDNRLGHSIKRDFIASGMTISEFAAAIHCNRTNVYSIFERYSFDCDQLCDICKALGVNYFRQLYEETEQMLGQQ